MRRATVLLAVVAGSACAQFQELAATDDGRQLYFTSSLTLKGSPPARPELRVYRVTADGLLMFAERGGLASKWSASSGDGADQPQVSGDGQTVGYTLRDVCLQENPCAASVSVGEIRGRHAMRAGQGGLQLSRNGRWALLSQVPNPFYSEPAILIDLDTGEHTPVPSPFAATHSVASDGTVLIRNTDSNGQFLGAGLWRAGQITEVPLTGIASPIALSDDASTLIYNSVTPGTFRFSIVARDLATGRDRVIFGPSPGSEAPFFMGMSNDGRWVLYRVGVNGVKGPAYIADTRTGESRAIELPDGEVAIDGTLSGWGNVAFLATSAGRIVSFELANGVPSKEPATLVPATPFVEPFSVTPGSLVRLHASLAMFSSNLTGSILFGGMPAPILYTSGDEIGIQVPWEVQANSEVPLKLNVANESPFEQNESLFVTGMAPAFETVDRFIREDFSGVTNQPGPDEIVHVYMTGLGPVRGPVQTGVPIPAGAIYPIEGTFTCQFNPHRGPAETLFAGAAPGMIGVYQVTFRMPADVGSGPVSGGSCSYTYASGGGNMSWAHLGGAGAP